MSPITHFFMGWVLANSVQSSRRDRALIVAASVLPDVDALPVVADVLMGRPADGLDLWSRYHHTLAHNIGFALLVTIACTCLARHRVMTGALSFLAIHLHLLGDIVGARGPDGYQWPIPYLLPFSSVLECTWSGQWQLNAWQNIVFTIVLIIASLWLAWRRGFSPMEFFWRRADAAVVNALRQRFGTP